MKKIITLLTLFLFLFLSLSIFFHIHNDLKNHNECKFCTSLSSLKSTSLNPILIAPKIIFQKNLILDKKAILIKFICISNIPARAPPINN